ncbi:MAG: DedA family protein [Patescibacteria group bacterium]
MENLVSLLTNYGYFILFPISVIEGPIVTIVAGFLASLGILNFFIVYVIVTLGDVLGDNAFYWAGRLGNNFFSRFFEKRHEKVERVKEYFRVNERKALILSKVFYGIGAAGLFTAGSLKVPYKRFLTICLLTTAVQSVALITIGVLFGQAYEQLNKYLNYYTTATIVVGLIIIFVIAIRKLKLFSD